MPSGGITFDLNIAAGKGEEHMSEHMKGSWENAKPAPQIDDGTALTGWQVFSLGPIRTQQGKSQIFDFGAKKSSSEARTVGDLRKLSQKKSE